MEGKKREKKGVEAFRVGEKASFRFAISEGGGRVGHRSGGRGRPMFGWMREDDVGKTEFLSNRFRRERNKNPGKGGNRGKKKSELLLRN